MSHRRSPPTAPTQLGRVFIRHGERGAVVAAFILFSGFCLIAGQASAQSVSCTCRYMGEDFGLGESICLKGPDGPRLATCGMVLNNTSWKVSEAPCPVSLLQTPVLAAMTPFPPIAPLTRVPERTQR